MAYRWKRGLGQTLQSPGTEDYTLLCSALPAVVANWFPACQIPSGAQITAANLSNYGAAATPATIAAGQTAAVQASQAYCQEHPSECAEYQLAVASPTTAAVLGTGTLGQTVASAAGGTSAVCDPSTDPTCSVAGTASVLPVCTETIVTGVCDWILYGAGIMAAVLLLLAYANAKGGR